jgi:type IV secretion system protein VirB4
MEARPTLASRLARWCEGGEFGWLFDNPKDLLDLNTHRMYGFDVTDFLENPETRTATMMYLIFRTEGMIDGRRFMYIFDEFWKLLDDPAFTKFAKDTLKTIRKKNGLAVFATQEPGDALNSPIAKTIVQQLATTIALYNPGADEADYVEGLKFSKSEFDLIQRIPEGSRRFLVKQADASALGVLNLSGFQDEMLVLSGTPDNAEILEQVISEVGEDPEIFLPAFIRRVRGQ